MERKSTTLLKDIMEHCENVQINHDKFYDKQNNTAGTRCRKYLQHIIDLSKDLRKEIQRIKNEERAMKEKNKGRGSKK